MSTIFKRLPVGGKCIVYKATGVYRLGAVAAAPAIIAMPVAEALASAKTKVDFLHTDTLKGHPLSG